MRKGIRIPNSGGLITTTAGPDLVHTLSQYTTAGGNVTVRSAIIRKIMAYNNTGANVTLIFGTRDRTGAPAFVPLMPAFVVINALDNEWEEVNIPAVEFKINRALLAAGREGNIWVQASAGAVLLVLELEEIG
jgi:hypothetical protein